MTNTIKFRIEYKPNGRNPEVYRKVSIIGYYNSNGYKNAGMTVIVPDRITETDRGIRRFDYDNVRSFEVEVAR